MENKIQYDASQNNEPTMDIDGDLNKSITHDPNKRPVWYKRVSFWLNIGKWFMLAWLPIFLISNIYQLYQTWEAIGVPFVHWCYNNIYMFIGVTACIIGSSVIIYMSCIYNKKIKKANDEINKLIDNEEKYN